MSLKDFIGSWPVFTLAAALMVSFSCPVSARMYRYRDGNGVIHFTDTLSKVPRDLLPGAEPLGPERTDLRWEADLKGPSTGNLTPSSGEGVNETEGNADQGKDPPIVERLNREKSALDAEYRNLAKEKAELERERSTLKTPEGVEAYRKKVRALNRRIEAYKERNRAYAKKVDAYNWALKEDKE